MTVAITSYPRSAVADSTVSEEHKDLYMEKLSNIIFQKEFSLLRPYQFIRSPIIRIDLGDYTYNHFFFNDFPKLQIVYNKIMNFPNFFLTKEEERLQMKQLELPYSPNDPSNYYCLGIYNEETN